MTPQACAPGAQPRSNKMVRPERRWLCRARLWLILVALAASPATGQAPTDDTLAVPYRFGDVGRWAPVFENPQRDRYQMPERVIAAIGVAQGATVADVGAATGYFARRFARAVGDTGRVYAVDIEPELLSWLAQRAQSEGIANIETITATATDSRLPDGCCDIIFLCNTYYMIGRRVAYLKHLQKKLKPLGRIVIIDWHKRPLPRGPHPEWKLRTGQVAQEASQAELCIADRPRFLPYQYFFILQRCDG